MRHLLVLLLLLQVLPARAAETPPLTPEAFVQQFYARYTADTQVEWIHRVEAQAAWIEAELLRDLRDAWKVSAYPDPTHPDILNVDPFAVVYTPVDAVKLQVVSCDAQRAFVKVQIVSQGRSTPLTLLLLAGGASGWQIGNVTYAHGVDLQSWLRRINRR